MIFPTWRYHRHEEPKLVHSEEQLKALGPGWADTPAAFEQPEKYHEHMEEFESKEEREEKQKPKRKKKAD